MSNNSIVNNREIIKKGGLLNNFLWICAGVDRKILIQCPTDYAKYAGQGGLILFTALMASLSGGYAFFTIFESRPLAVFFGIFWGLLIFNLDRFIVNTMYSDGKYTISWGELAAGTPRLIIAVFIGIVISTPLEMKIFEDRIESQIVKDNIERGNITLKTASEGNQVLIERRNKLEAERAEINRALNEAKQKLTEEAEGISVTGKPGRGPVYSEKLAIVQSLEKQLSDWEAAHDEELKGLIEQIQHTTKKTKIDVEKTNEDKGFCVRYEAYSNLKKGSPTIRIVSLFITLLFIIIEVCPTFFKMMVAAGPYDCLLDAERHAKKVSSMKLISDLNDRINTEIQISTGKNRNRIETELAKNRELLGQVSSVQSEILSTAIEKWREEELQKVHENPSQYIHSNRTT